MTRNHTVADAAPPEFDDVTEQLRVLAAAAAATVRARPDLGQVVSTSARRRRRSRLIRRTALGVGGGIAVAASLAAASLFGSDDYFTVAQPSAAMESTVYVGERVVLSKKLSPTRGDVVVVHLVRDGHEYDAMFRVVGLPGDTVACPAGPTGRCDAVVVNGVPVAEPYLGAAVTDPFSISTVPAGMLFLLGDNRAAANDSRHIGPVELASVTGVAVQIRGRDGQVRGVPGAPAHDGPGERDNVDPAGRVPPPAVSTP